MSITIQVEVPVVDVEVDDTYAITLTVTDPLTHATAVVALDQEQTAELIQMLNAAKSEAMSKLWEDRGNVTTFRHGFDTDGGDAA